MEDVLDVYQRPLDPKRPQVCLDEGSKQLLHDSREPIPMRPVNDAQPGHPVREDYEYVRDGMCSFFMMFAPLLCWRHLAVTERRTAKDFAHVVRDLVDLHFPDADKIVLVLDNLNTHTAASLYEAFPPAEAKRIADKLEIHYTPKHGSWLGYPLGDGRDRIVCTWPTVPRQTNTRCEYARARSACLGASTQCGRYDCQLALYNRRCSDQVAQTLSGYPTLKNY
jgi:hypothetical protein